MCPHCLQQQNACICPRPTWYPTSAQLHHQPYGHYSLHHAMQNWQTAPILTPFRDETGTIVNTQSKSKGKRKRTTDNNSGNENSSRPKRTRSSAAHAANENNPPTPSVPGVGPSHRMQATVEEIEDPDAPPSSSVYTTTQSRRVATSETAQAASDVWWFMRQLDDDAKPSTPPPELSNEDRARSKPKCKFVGCSLCPQ